MLRPHTALVASFILLLMAPAREAVAAPPGEDPVAPPRSTLPAYELNLAVDIPVTSIAHQRRLREALIAARPSPCRCMYDDYWDHHLTRAHRLKGIARAARRTLRARRLRRR